MRFDALSLVAIFAAVVWYVLSSQAPDVPGGLVALPIAILAVATFVIAYDAGKEKGRMHAEAAAGASGRALEHDAREGETKDGERGAHRPRRYGFSIPAE